MGGEGVGWNLPIDMQPEGFFVFFIFWHSHQAARNF